MCLSVVASQLRLNHKSLISPNSFLGQPLRDVLALKTKIDAQRAAMEALADDAEDLKQRYGL
jgi:hypothetical protein